MVGGCGDVGDYKFEGLLGKGSFGEVREATDLRNGEKVAIKMISRSKVNSNKARARLANEYKIHSTVHHPNIVALKNFFQNSKKVFFVLEVCKQGELADLLKKKKRFGEVEARGYFRQLVEGVSYLHSHWIIHRDIKLANLLLTEDNVLKLADFGLAAQLECQDSERLTLCGTPNYLSPEIAKRQPYTLATDVWSLGVVLYTMLCGKPPFQEDEVAETIERVKSVDFECPDYLSPAASDMIHRILHGDKSKRLKLKDIKQHPFYTGEHPQAAILDSHHGESTPRKSMAVASTGSPTSEGTGDFTPPNRVLRSIQPCQTPECVQSLATKSNPAWTPEGAPTEGSPFQPDMFAPSDIDPTVEIGVTPTSKNAENTLESRVGGNEFSMDIENCSPGQFGFGAVNPMHGEEPPIQGVKDSWEVDAWENVDGRDAIGQEGYVPGFATNPDQLPSGGVLSGCSPCGNMGSKPGVRIDFAEMPSPQCEEQGEVGRCINGDSTTNQLDLAVTASPTGDALTTFSKTVTFGAQGSTDGFEMVGDLSNHPQECQYDPPKQDLSFTKDGVCQFEQNGQGNVDHGGLQESGKSEGGACFFELGDSGSGIGPSEGFSLLLDTEESSSSSELVQHKDEGGFVREPNGSGDHGRDAQDQCQELGALPGWPAGEETVSSDQIGTGDPVELTEIQPFRHGTLDGMDSHFYAEGNGCVDGVENRIDSCPRQAFWIQDRGVGQSRPLGGAEGGNQDSVGLFEGGIGQLQGSGEQSVRCQLGPIDPVTDCEGQVSSSEQGGASFGPRPNQKDLIDPDTYVKDNIVGLGHPGTSVRGDPTIMEMLYGALMGSCMAEEIGCGESVALEGAATGGGMEETKDSRMARLRNLHGPRLPPERIKRLLLESGMHAEDPLLSDAKFLGDFACEQSNELPNEYTGKVVHLPELPPLDPRGVENVESLCGVVINGCTDQELSITMPCTSLEKPEFPLKPEGRLGFQQSPDHELQFWHLGRHFSGPSAHTMRDTLEKLATEGRLTVMHGDGPYSSHTPYCDLDMRMCRPTASRKVNKLPPTRRLPHGYSWTPPNADFQALVQLLPDKHVCVTMMDDGGKHTRFQIDPNGSEVCIEREPTIGGDPPEPILKYTFPELPKCAMDAYQAACDFVRSVANGVLKIEYTAYYGVGRMYENGSLSLELDPNHARELGVLRLDLVDLLDERRVQINCSEGEPRQVPIQRGPGVGGSRYSVIESFVDSLTQSELRAIELIFLCKGSCEDVCAQASDAECQGRHVLWPLYGVDRIDAS